MLNQIKQKIINKEFLVFFLIIIYSFVIRLYKLSSIPSVINGDEVGSIIHPLQILINKSGNIFSLTHDHSISYVVYLFKALSIVIFGVQNSLFAVRLTTVIISILTLIPFYQILKGHVNKSVALITTFAFSSNYWFSNFSRLSWIAVDCLLPGLYLLLYTEKAIKENRIKNYIFVAVLSAIVLYNYMGGRIFFLASFIILFFNLFTSKNKKVKKKLKNFVFYIASTFLLFLPQFIVILKNPSLYLLRANSINVFRLNNLYYGISPDNKIALIKHQISYAVRGFIFFDSKVAAEGVENQRLIPNASSGINILIKLLFWMGLIIFLIRKKEDSIWLLVFILNILFLQIPSVYIPSWSRAIGVIPIIYFFAAIALQEVVLFTVKFKPKLTSFVYLTIAIILITFSLNDVNRYWTWVKSPNFYAAQQPAIDISNNPIWLDMQIKRIKTNKPIINNYEWNASYLNY
jgi:hypothetical protein